MASIMRTHVSEIADRYKAPNPIRDDGDRMHHSLNVADITPIVDALDQFVSQYGQIPGIICEDDILLVVKTEVDIVIIGEANAYMMPDVFNDVLGPQRIPYDTRNTVRAIMRSKIRELLSDVHEDYAYLSGVFVDWISTYQFKIIWQKDASYDEFGDPVCESELVSLLSSQD